MQIMVTGNLGYIGAWVTPLLQERGHTVIGCDLGLFQKCEWRRLAAPDHQLHCDVLDLTAGDLEGCDAVIHLAALSNDPMGELDPSWTRRANLDATLHLAKIAKESSVSRFLFAGSCSIYGKGKEQFLDESSLMCPLTAYAHSKVESEQGLARLADENFSPTFLRNATAFGDSPMLRIDLVANNLLACAIARGRIEIHSDGTPWRPLVHCKDIARAFVCCLDVPRETVHNQAINVGCQNVQVWEIAEEVKRLVTDASIEYTGQVGPDPRNYSVSFDRLRQLLPNFEPEFDLRSGLEDLAPKMEGFSESDFTGDQFIRIKSLLHAV